MCEREVEISHIEWSRMKWGEERKALYDQMERKRDYNEKIITLNESKSLASRKKIYHCENIKI